MKPSLEKKDGRKQESAHVFYEGPDRNVLGLLDCMVSDATPLLLVDNSRR